MSAADAALASIALPVRNGEHTLARVVESVLGQSHDHLELVISDNASTDGTEEICRHFAARDERVVYHRHPTDVGLLNNFRAAAELTRGDYLRWIGDSDHLEEDYLARTLACFVEEDRRVLVTTRVCYVDELGRTTVDESYVPAALDSPDPLVRFSEMLSLMARPYTYLDPLYGLMRREVALLARRNLLGEDQVFAARLALAGRWGHVPAVLARRDRSETPVADLVGLLGVPRWHAHARDLIQSRELLTWIDASALTDAQKRRARGRVLRLYTQRKHAKARRGVARFSSFFPDRRG